MASCFVGNALSSIFWTFVTAGLQPACAMVLPCAAQQAPAGPLHPGDSQDELELNCAWQARACHYYEFSSATTASSALWQPTGLHQTEVPQQSTWVLHQRAVWGFLYLFAYVHLTYVHGSVPYVCRSQFTRQGTSISSSSSISQASLVHAVKCSIANSF